MIDKNREVNKIRKLFSHYKKIEEHRSNPIKQSYQNFASKTINERRLRELRHYKVAFHN